MFMGRRWWNVEWLAGRIKNIVWFSYWKVFLRERERLKRNSVYMKSINQLSRIKFKMWPIMLESFFILFTVFTVYYIIAHHNIRDTLW